VGTVKGWGLLNCQPFIFGNYRGLGGLGEAARVSGLSPKPSLGHLGRQAEGGFERAGVSLTRAGQVVGGAVVHGGTDDGQA